MDLAASASGTAPRPSYPFEVKSRDILRIALPASVAFITEPLVGLVDITVIGRLGDAALLGGLVLAALVFDTVYSLVYFLRVGTAGLTAQAVGARDPKDGLVHVSRAILVAVALGLVLIALWRPLLAGADLVLAPPPDVGAALGTYFFVRILGAPFSLINFALLGWFYGRGKASTGMSLQILIHGANIVFNVLFVFGLGWSVAGTAAATVLGNALAAIAGLALLARHFGGPRRLFGLLSWAELLDGAALKRMFALSRDITIRTLALMGSYVYFAAQGSRAGEVVLAGNAVLMNMLMIMAFFLDGLAQAAEQLAGKAVGANWRPAFDGAVRLALSWGIAIGLVLTAAAWLGGPSLIAVMTTSPEVRAHADSYLWLAAVTGLTGMAAFVMDGVVSGATLNTVMRNGMLVAFGVYLALALALQPLLGNTGLWLAINGFFVARGGILWWGMNRRKAGLFS